MTGAASNQSANKSFSQKAHTPIFSKRKTPPKFPIHLLGLSGHYIQPVAKSISCPPDYIAAGLLGAAAGLIGNSREVRITSTWSEPTILNCAIIGDPSMKKTPALKPFVKQLKLLESDLADGYEQRIREYIRREKEASIYRRAWEQDCETAAEAKCPTPLFPEKAQQPDKPQRERLVVMDTTVEALGEVLSAQPKGVLLFADELAGFMASMDRYASAKGGDRAFFLECYNAECHVIDRKSLDAPIQIDRLSVSILGGFQPDRLSTALLSADDDGLPARFLYFWPDRVPFNGLIDSSQSPLLSTALQKLHNLEMQTNALGSLVPVSISLSPDAKDLFEECYRRMDSLTEDATGYMAGFLGKAPGTIIRLANILTHLDYAFAGGHPPAEIENEVIQRAWSLYEQYLIPMADRAFHDCKRPREEIAAERIVQYILKHRKVGYFTATEIRRGWKVPGFTNADAKTIKDALEILQDAGWITHEPTRQGNTPGRQKDLYLINGDVHK